mmetsp:Transcript_22722/g.37602  ORF Transcript_22722/g.37602 Transcript_22722/m.37602 type:complete len:296 (-) Transcript_22722:94-981(-)|eukprot:CAMPEP_0119008652 /NCGR_PEP_ID=MMETSP1176-20130426/3847_1 /TAXON_ID=265551 /ORGANISM="Synedropsis recta cf, Strain CCMP1620" /LENGTH=295 /DNA_ID=CAMNT_0006961025 /DNA_START=52 /DNA_END=939 /DNA_ORIENTATION=-
MVRLSTTNKAPGAFLSVKDGGPSSQQGQSSKERRSNSNMLRSLVILVLVLLALVSLILQKNGLLQKKKVVGPEITEENLLKFEQHYGGYVRNVKRHFVSKFDVRHQTQPADWQFKGGMTGGDRMDPKLHNYAPYYTKYFQPLQESVKSVAEIGILKGSGVAMWSTFFPEAQIHGFDINAVNIKDNMEFLVSKGAFEHSALELHHFDQLEKDAKLPESTKKFPIIIDDGYHTDEAVLITWHAFFPFLDRDGVYVVEDCKCEPFQKFIADTYPGVLELEYIQTSKFPGSFLIFVKYV